MPSPLTPGHVQDFPKVELHVHLEGSIQPATLLTLAERNQVRLPATDEQGLREWFQFRDFAHFVEVYDAISRCLRTTDDFDLIAFEFGREMARQNTRYAEVTFTAGTHYANGVAFDTYFAGLQRGRERAHREFGVRMSWIFDIDRDGSEQLADYTVDAAIQGMCDGVVALGLGGTERDRPARRYIRQFDRARAAGLHSVPHAGELDGPDSVRESIEVLGAERIGHGVRAVEDPNLVEYLAEHRVPIEVSPTSNLRLGVYPDAASHPLPVLAAAGVRFSVNSDDPALFNTTLEAEYVHAVTALSLDAEGLRALVTDAALQAFLPSAEREALVASLATG